MDFLFAYWFEILLGIFLLSWLILRQSGIWQKNVTAHHEDQQFIRGTYDEVFRAVGQALTEHDFTIREKNYDKGIVTAEVPWTMKSFGERIQMQLRPQKEYVHLHILSTCKLETQLFDWGKNRENVDRLFESVKKLT